MSNTKKSLKGLSQSDINKIHLKAQEGDINAIQYYVNDRRTSYLKQLVETLKHKRNSSTNSSSKEKYNKAIQKISEELADFSLLRISNDPSNTALRNPWEGGKHRHTKKRKHTKRRQTKKRQTRRR